MLHCVYKNGLKSPLLVVTTNTNPAPGKSSGGELGLRGDLIMLEAEITLEEMDPSGVLLSKENLKNKIAAILTGIHSK